MILTDTYGWTPDKHLIQHTDMGGYVLEQCSSHFGCIKNKIFGEECKVWQERLSKINTGD